MLESVNLSKCELITDVSVVALAGSCPLLKSVNLACCELITDVSVVALAGGCLKLESLSLPGSEIIDASIPALEAALPGVSVYF